MERKVSLNYMAISNFHLWSSLLFLANFLIPIHCHGHFGHCNKRTAPFIFGDSLIDSGNNNYINTTTNTHAAALFIFGDSLFDCGNNNYINTTTSFQGNFYPYGETFFNYPTGRGSDGRIIPDFISEYANLPLIKPYQQPGNHQFDYGANFASGGAGALDETFPGMVINLNTQLKNFENVEAVLRQKFGDKEAKKMLLNSVYLFSIGGNDYASPQVINSITNSTIYQSHTQKQYVEMVIGNLTTVIKEIYKKGGRKFGFLNVGPLGHLPLSELLFPRNCSGCLEEFTSLVKLHNSALSKVLQNLEKQFKGFKYSNFNFYDSLGERIINPSKYGFKVGNSGCCGSGPNRGINSCGGKRGIKEYELCDDPSEYVFFDSSHPTEMTNYQMAMLMWSGTPKLTGPYNLKSLFQHTQG